MMQMVREGSTELALEIRSETITCHAGKFLTVEKENILVISDLHLGKIDHFRKHGLGLPGGLDKHDLHLLEDIFLQQRPDLCIFLGDLFHSDYNKSWDQFASFIGQFKTIDFLLVEGNHDILHPELYAACGMNTTAEFKVGSLSFTHEPRPGDEDCYNIHGHIHPGYQLTGKARQRLTLPCFHFGQNAATMPAFGRFTGLHPIQPRVDDQLVLISGSALYPIQMV